ncbi:MAG: hypothetical protein K6T17_07205, partial [Fimbriimonadales bacterium]|nr:hypothetical protein [Fimbriimonadales bacterium]
LAPSGAVVSTLTGRPQSSRIHILVCPPLSSGSRITLQRAPSYTAVSMTCALVKSVFSESVRSQLEQKGFVPLPPELARLSWERFVKKVTGSLLDPPRKGSDKLRELLTASQ